MTTAATIPSSDRSSNEDWHAVTGDAWVVLDGATIRTHAGCHHGLPWYVRQLGASLLAGVQDETQPLRSVLASAIRQVSAAHEGTCDLTHPGTPSAAVGIIRRSTSHLEWLVLGDITALILTDRGLITDVDDRVSQTAQTERREADRHPIGSAGKQDALGRMKAVELASRNIPGGYWIASTDPEAAEHAHAGSVPLDRVRATAMCSDGAMRALDMTPLDTPEQVLTALQVSGPRALLDRVRAAEHADPDGIRVPRNKSSDDAKIGRAHV